MGTMIAAHVLLQIILNQNLISGLTSKIEEALAARGLNARIFSPANLPECPQGWRLRASGKFAFHCTPIDEYVQTICDMSTKTGEMLYFNEIKRVRKAPLYRL